MSEFDVKIEILKEPHPKKEKTTLKTQTIPINSFEKPFITYLNSYGEKFERKFVFVVLVTIKNTKYEKYTTNVNHEVSVIFKIDSTTMLTPVYSYNIKFKKPFEIMIDETKNIVLVAELPQKILSKFKKEFLTMCVTFPSMKCGFCKKKDCDNEKHQVYCGYNSNEVKLKRSEENFKLLKIEQKFKTFFSDVLQMEKGEKEIEMVSEKKKDEKKIKLEISLRKGNHKASSVSTKKGWKLFQFVLLFGVKKFDFENNRVLNLCFEFVDKNEKVFLEKLVVFQCGEFENKTEITKKIIIKERMIIFEEFPVIVRIRKLGKYCSNDIILRRVEHLRDINIFEIKNKKYLPKLLKELKDKEYCFQDKEELNELPFEMIYEIVSFLPLLEIMRSVTRVNSYFHDVCNCALEECVKRWLISNTGINKKILFFMYSCNNNSWKSVYSNLSKFFCVILIFRKNISIVG